MRTQANPEETSPAGLGSREDPAEATHGDLLESGLRRDQRWRELRRKSLQAELRALDRAPQWSALIVFWLIVAAASGWMLISVVNGNAEVNAGNWIGLILTPLTLAFIPAMMMRTLAIGICQGLRRIILRRAKNDHIER